MPTLTEIYDRKVAEGLLRADAGQRATLPLLEEIRTALETRQPPAKGLFARFSRKAPEPVKGLYLWGGVGRGKSMLMDLFMEAVAIPGKRRVHFHAFMQEVQAGLNDARARGIQDAILPVAEKISGELRLLCFDEMQITDIADAMIVGRLFQKLFDAGVVVVTTSNRPPDDLYKNGLNRQLFLPFIGLLKERLAVHEIASETDYRQHRLAGAPVYFSPVNPAAHEAIEAIWNDLTGHAPPRPLFLTVNGRKVEVPAFHNGVARARFWDFCAQPLGPADYLALTDAARVLILEDIPRLSRSNFNEAKRFVTLIDAVYEARIRFVCSAADVPEQLYQEGEGAFEFERTASRLREMQGADWAAATEA